MFPLPSMMTGCESKKRHRRSTNRCKQYDSSWKMRTMISDLTEGGGLSGQLELFKLPCPEMSLAVSGVHRGLYTTCWYRCWCWYQDIRSEIIDCDILIRQSKCFLHETADQIKSAGWCSAESVGVMIRSLLSQIAISHIELWPLICIDWNTVFVHAI